MITTAKELRIWFGFATQRWVLQADNGPLLYTNEIRMHSANLRTAVQHDDNGVPMGVVSVYDVVFEHDEEETVVHTNRLASAK